MWICCPSEEAKKNLKNLRGPDSISRQVSDGGGIKGCMTHVPEDGGGGRRGQAKPDIKYTGARGGNILHIV